MCGGHRRKPASEDNEEEEPNPDAAVANTESGSGSDGQAFMLSSLKPANGKFVLGPPVETTPPIVVFTGSPENPDSAAQAVSAAPKKKKTKTAKAVTEKPAADKPAAAGDKPKAADKKTAVKPAAKPAKPKVSSVTQ
jgi:D-alanyl-D-alanine carboxypeptidase